MPNFAIIPETIQVENKERFKSFDSHFFNFFKKNKFFLHIVFNLFKIKRSLTLCIFFKKGVYFEGIFIFVGSILLHSCTFGRTKFGWKTGKVRKTIAR